MVRERYFVETYVRAWYDDHCQTLVSATPTTDFVSKTIISLLLIGGAATLLRVQLGT